jgi:hypothetical protein
MRRKTYAELKQRVRELKEENEGLKYRLDRITAIVEGEDYDVNDADSYVHLGDDDFEEEIRIRRLRT